MLQLSSNPLWEFSEKLTKGLQRNVYVVELEAEFLDINVELHISIAFFTLPQLSKQMVDFSRYIL